MVCLAALRDYVIRHLGKFYLPDATTLKTAVL